MIIHVDSTDEINSIIRRLEHASEASVTLVIPADYSVLRDAINLRLLIKYAKDYNKELCIQSNDQVLGRLADEQGIRFVPEESAGTIEQAASEDGASDKDGRSAFDPTRRKRLWRDRLVVVLLICFAVFGLVYINVPQALVVITPDVRMFSERVVFSFDQLKAAIPVETTISLTRRTPATGRKTVGVSHAEGVIVLVNQDQASVFIQRGTVVKTGSDIAFVTTTDLTIPAVETQFFMDIPTGIRAGQAEVAIEALSPGSRYNVAAGRIQTILGYDIDVRNPEPTTGGEDAILPVAADNDIERVKDLIRRDVRQVALEALQSKIGTGMVLEDTLTVEIDWKAATAVGEETDEVFQAAISRAHVYMLDPVQLTNQAEDALHAIIPRGFHLLPETVTMQNVRVNEGSEGFELSISISGQAYGHIDVDQITNRLLGSTLAEVVQVSANNPEIANIRVEQNRGERLPRYRRWLRVEFEQLAY